MYNFYFKRKRKGNREQGKRKLMSIWTNEKMDIWIDGQLKLFVIKTK